MTVELIQTELILDGNSFHKKYFVIFKKLTEVGQSFRNRNGKIYIIADFIGRLMEKCGETWFLKCKTWWQFNPDLYITL